jgi:competence protein ComEA
MHTRIATVPAVSLTLILAGWLAAPPSGAAQATKTQQKEKAAAKERLDLNAASEEELMELPGVGTATARKIIAGRPYKSVEGLAKAGVPEATIEKIKHLVIVHRTATEKSKAAAEKVATETGEPLDLNKASVTDLQTLPGIGPALAREIVAARPFKSVDELERIKGLGPAKIAAIKDRVTVAAAPTKPARATAKRAAATPADTPATTEEPKTASRPEPSARPERPATGKTASKSRKATITGKININTASREELEELPGIGPVKSQAIMDARPFEKIEDIMKTKGIKEGEFSKIKDLITVK